MIVGNAQSIGLAALRAATARQAQSAQNVANVNTPGYQASGATPATTSASSGSSSARFASLSGSFTPPGAAGEVAESNTDLAAETVEQMSALHAFKANIVALRTSDEMTQSVLNIKA